MVNKRTSPTHALKENILDFNGVHPPFAFLQNHCYGTLCILPNDLTSLQVNIHWPKVSLTL